MGNKVAFKKIAIFRALNLGDLLCIIPTARALRESFPNSSITLIGLPWNKSFVQRFSRYFNNFIEFPGYPGLPEQEVKPTKVIPFLKRVQKERFDLVLQMHDDGTVTNSLVSLFNASETAGFFLPGNFYPNGGYFLPYPKNEHEIQKHLKLIKLLRIPYKEEDLEFPINYQEKLKAQIIQKRYGLDKKPYICIHPGARDQKRRWGEKYFADVADFIIGLGFKIVLTGTSEEQKIANRVEINMKKRPVNLAGKTSLGVLGSILQDASLLVANDTGVSHIAEALSVPSVTIFTNSDPLNWAPLNRSLHRVVDKSKAYTPNFVIQEIKELLEEDYTAYEEFRRRNMIYE